MSTYESDMVVVNLRGMYRRICYIIYSKLYASNPVLTLGYNMLKHTVPEIPTMFENIPYYSDNNNDLLRIMTTFRTVVGCFA